MAMTKKEKAAMDAAIYKAELLRIDQAMREADEQ